MSQQRIEEFKVEAAIIQRLVLLFCFKQFHQLTQKKINSETSRQHSEVVGNVHHSSNLHRSLISPIIVVSLLMVQ